jgi:hypothetical protein
MFEQNNPQSSYLVHGNFLDFGYAQDLHIAQV